MNKLIIEVTLENTGFWARLDAAWALLTLRIDGVDGIVVREEDE